MTSASHEVRAFCRTTVRRAKDVRIDDAAVAGLSIGAAPPLDPDVHLVDAPRADVASYVLALDAINFGSGWFAELPGLDYDAVAGGLRAAWLADGPWTPRRLRAITARDVARAIAPLPAEHVLAAHFTRALRDLGRHLADRSALDLVEDADGVGQRLVARLAGLRTWRDPGFLKRAQIVVNDLELAGVATFRDRGELTVFADNALPAVLRQAGVLVVDDALAARIDAGQELPRGRAERELRAGAVVACEALAARLGVPEHELDNALWHLAIDGPGDGVALHRTRTLAY